ncbi:hypothetical protein [Streptomyces djakartensis]
MTTMRSYGFTWTDRDGTRRASAVAYDTISADRVEKDARRGILRCGGRQR